MNSSFSSPIPNGRVMTSALVDRDASLTELLSARAEFTVNWRSGLLGCKMYAIALLLWRVNSPPDYTG